MKIKSFIILLLVPILITNCAQPIKDATNDIVAANAVFVEHFNAHNGKVLGELYTKNGRLFPANSPVIEGQEAIGQFWSAIFGMGIDNATLKTVHVETFDNTAVEEGAYKLFDVEGNQLDDGKYIIVWKNVDGQWRIDRDIFSSNLPAPEPPKAEESNEGDADDDQA